MEGKKILAPGKELSDLFAGAKGAIVVASCLINLLALALPLLMLQLYDRILPFRSLETLGLLAVTVLTAILIESLLRGVRAHITAWVAARFEHRAMNAVTSRALAEPLHRFERKGTGLLMDRFRSVSTLKHHYSGQSFQQLLDLPFTALYVGVVFLISPWIGWLLVAGYSIFLLVTLVRGRNFPELVTQQKEADARRGNFLNETLANIHTLKSMTMESLMLRRHERLQENCARLLSRLTYSLDLASGLGSIFSPLMTMLTVALGAWLVIQGYLTDGELAACVLLGMRALSPLQRLGGLWSRHQQDNVLRDQLLQTLRDPGLESREQPKDDEAPNARAAEACAIELKDITYQFPSATQPIFDGLNFKINAGECVLISGESGSGFSTLLKLMAGILQPDKGEVLLDGRPCTSSADLCTERVAYLPQTAEMFEGSLIENISLFDSSRADAAILRAKQVGLSSFVSRLPRGWDSSVGDMAVDSLPPGFRQRLAIIRALSNNPDIILFDEATSSMDIEGERQFQKYIESMKGRVTIVIVSQRPVFQQLADRTLYLRDGKLSESNEALSLDVDQRLSKTTSLQRPLAIVRAQAPTATHAMLADPASLSEQRWLHAYETIARQFKETSDFAGCLAVLLKQINVGNSAREVAEALPYFTESLDLAGFHNTMAQLGYRMTEVQGTLGSIDSRALPCLFVPDEEEYAFVVMGRVGRAARIATDPSAEPRSESNLDMRGRAFFYELSTASEVDSGSWVKSVLLRFRPLFGQAAASSLVSGLLMVSGSLFLIVVYGTVIPSGAIDTLFYLTVGTALALVSGYFFVRHRARILAYIAGRIEYLFGATILQQVLRMSPIYTERTSVGSQTARIRSFEAVRDLFTGPLASTVLELPATLVLVVALSLINPLALLVFAIMLAAYFALYRLFLGPARRRMALVSQTASLRHQFLVEMISKMRTVRECKAQNLWAQRFRDISANSTMATFQAEKLAATMSSVSYGVMMTAALTIVVVSVPAVWDDALGSGALIASMILMWRVLGPVQTIFTNLTRTERVLTAIKQIDSLLKIQGERPESVTMASSRTVEGSIEFARVSFRYSLNADPALIGVEFRIKAGELVAVSGPNGGGKSTLLKLILGMCQPQAGAILIDNIDIRQLDPLELRRLVAYAPQEVQLFRATLLQNLRLACPDASNEEVAQAVEMAGATEQIAQLPKGLEYRVGDNTNELPSSLKQKLSLARAYLTNAPVLLLDEPGTALDEAGDQQFMRTLQQLKGKRTVIFITHRPSHMRLADTLLVFDRGYLRAAGPPEKLLKQVTAA